MPPSFHLGSVHLRVSDLARSVDFYSRQVGFVVSRQQPPRAELRIPGSSSAGEPQLVLIEDRSAPPPPSGAAGLFHAALLLPSRAALGRWLPSAERAGVSFAGFSHHSVSEALYFSDPDGNGLEFYSDRPRELWPYDNGQLAMDTRPLDVRSLLAAGETAPTAGPTLAGAIWGHFHFRVTNLDRSEKFYSEVLGVTLTQRYGTSARFLSAEGYHHHVGLNTWGNPRVPHSEATLGLVEVSFVRPQAAEPSRTWKDPDGIRVRVAGIP